MAPMTFERGTDSQEPNLSYEGISKILWIFVLF